MVKPALAYLDVIRRVKDTYGVPLAAYNVSGESTTVHAVAERGWMERERSILGSDLHPPCGGGPDPHLPRAGGGAAAEEGVGGEATLGFRPPQPAAPLRPEDLKLRRSGEARLIDLARLPSYRAVTRRATSRGNPAGACARVCAGPFRHEAAHAHGPWPWLMGPSRPPTWLGAAES
jgi:hypothetical protein